jgi:hypothetical protein
MTNYRKRPIKAEIIDLKVFITFLARGVCDLLILRKGCVQPTYRLLPFSCGCEGALFGKNEFNGESFGSLSKGYSGI